jgi:hypothetical protein
MPCVSMHEERIPLFSLQRAKRGHVHAQEVDVNRRQAATY